MRRLILYPRAVADVERAVRWYEAQREGLSKAFVSALEETLERVRRTPETFPAKHGAYKGAALKRFPYQVFFRHDETAVYVALVFHTSQDPIKLGKALHES